MSQRLFTSESVTEGHPDKVADQISDAVLDAILEGDPNARAGIETLISNGFCVVAGELKTSTYVPITDIVRQKLREIGYTHAEFGFDYRSTGVLIAVGEQSPDVERGISGKAGAMGSADQGIVYGYACSETPEKMPLTLMLSHKLAKELALARKNSVLPYLYPDGKVQVTLRYEEERAIALEHVVVSAQHSAQVPMDVLKEQIIEDVIKPSLPKDLDCSGVQYHINPTGAFVIGGPQADTGLTGRKSIVDTYGGACPHGGGSLSGKDPSKMDRSGAYMARYIAKNLVAAGVADRLLVQLAYVMGESEPVSLSVKTFGTGKVDDEVIAKAIPDIFPLKPKEILEALDLLKPRYAATSVYGHFGRENEGFSWEVTDRVDAVRNRLGI